MEYVIEFKHLVEQTYKAIVEADSKEEAVRIFNEDPFSNLEDEDPIDEQGLEITIQYINEKE
jgi:hypothetical protein